MGIAGILFSVLLYGGIFYFGFVAKTGPFADLKVKQVSQLIKMDAGQIVLYKGQHGQLPEALGDVGKPSEKICSSPPIPGERSSNIPSSGTTTSN